MLREGRRCVPQLLFLSPIRHSVLPRKPLRPLCHPLHSLSAQFCQVHRSICLGSVRRKGLPGTCAVPGQQLRQDEGEGGVPF